MADQSLIAKEPGSTYKDAIIATRDEKGTYAFVYLPQNKPVSIDLGKISGDNKIITWFDPRTGKSNLEKPVRSNGVIIFTPPKKGMDWVLIIDDASLDYKTP
jgi:hypothetical protein